MTETFKLSEPIRVGGEEVTELTLRKPTVDMLQGTNLVVTGDGGLRIDADVVIKVFAKLANIPPSSVKQISGDDYTEMVSGLYPFFRGVPGNWRDIIGYLAWFFHWPPSEIAQLTVEQMLFWHGQARRIYEETHGNG